MVTRVRKNSTTGAKALAFARASQGTSCRRPRPLFFQGFMVVGLMRGFARGREALCHRHGPLVRNNSTTGTALAFARASQGTSCRREVPSSTQLDLLRQVVRRGSYASSQFYEELGPHELMGCCLYTNTKGTTLTTIEDARCSKQQCHTISQLFLEELWKGTDTYCTKVDKAV